MHDFRSLQGEEKLLVEDFQCGAMIPMMSAYVRLWARMCGKRFERLRSCRHQSDGIDGS